jgi:hypothetical protein
MVFPLKVGRVLQAECELRSTTVCPSLSLGARGKNDTVCKSEDDGVGRERVTKGEAALDAKGWVFWILNERGDMTKEALVSATQ